MLSIREKAFLTLLICIPLCSCDNSEKKSGNEKKDSSTQDLCGQQQQFGTGTSEQQMGYGQGQTAQNGGFGQGQTNNYQNPPTTYLVPGDLYTKLKTECGECHNGTEASDFNDPAVVTSAGAEILDRVNREPGTEGFMPENGTAKVTFLTDLQSWQTAGFPDISQFDPAATTGLPPGGTGEYPTNNGSFGNSNQFNPNCPTSTNGMGTNSGGWDGQGQYNQGQYSQGQNTGGYGQGGTTGDTTQGGGTTF